MVLGVSPDSVAQQAKFKAHEALPFTLLADPNHAIIEQYGLWVEKTNYGKTYWGVARSTFIIDPAGDIAAILRKVKPDTHSQQVLATLRTLQKEYPTP